MYSVHAWMYHVCINPFYCSKSASKFIGTFSYNFSCIIAHLFKMKFSFLDIFFNFNATFKMLKMLALNRVISLNRGLQAISVQFRFAFSKPSSSQTRFLNRPVAAPAEVAHFCRYKKFIFRPICVLKGGYSRQYFCLQYPLFKTQNLPKNNFFGSDRSGLLRRAPQLDGLENEFANWTV